MGHADIEGGAAAGERLADESDGRHRAMLQDENLHGLVSSAENPGGRLSETLRGRSFGSVGQLQMRGFEAHARYNHLEVPQRFRPKAGQTNKGRLTS